MSKLFFGVAYGAYVGLDQSFFDQLQSATALSIPPAHQPKIERELNEYLALRSLLDAAVRPGEVVAPLQAIGRLSAQLAALIESRETDRGCEAACVLMENADEKTWDVHNWREISEALRRLEQLSGIATGSLPKDSGGDNGDRFLPGLIRHQHAIFLDCGGTGKSCWERPDGSGYSGRFHAWMTVCLGRLEQEWQLPEHLAQRQPVPRYTPSGPTGLGKAILRALK